MSSTNVTLGSQLEFLTSGSRGWAKYYSSAGAPFLRIQNVKRNELRLDDLVYVNAPDDAEARRTEVRAGDVLLSITADLGRTAVVPTGLGPTYINQHLAVLRLKPTLLPEYVSAYLGLGPGRGQLMRLDRKGVKSALNFEDIRSVRIPLISLPEQRRIAALLDQADAIRRKRREAIALAESFLRSAFLEMFGDPVGNPLGWEVVRLASTFAEGPQLGTVVPVEETGTVPVVRVGQLGARELNWAAMGKVNLGASELGRFRLNEGDVLLARAIGSLDHLGKASVVGNLASTAVFDSHVMRLRLDHSVMLPQFFHTFLLTPGGRTRFLARASRTAVQFNISGTNIAEMLLPLPPMRLQRQFVDLAEAHALVVQKLEQAQREAERMFEGLVAGVLERQFSMRLPTPQVALPIGPDARRRALTRVT